MKYQNGKEREREKRRIAGFVFSISALFTLILIAIIATLVVVISPTNNNALPPPIYMYANRIASVTNCSYTVNITGTDTNNNIFGYLYVGLQRSSIDSIQTPASSLPLFSPSFTAVSFESPLIVGDIIINEFYSSSNRMSSLLSSTNVTFYQTCLVNMTGIPICFFNGDFCSYPIEVGEIGSGIYLYNLAEVTIYVQSITGQNDTSLDTCSGCFSVFSNVAVTSNITVNANAINNFILSVGTQVGTREFTPCLTGYTFGPLEYYETPVNIFVDFYINYGDGSPVQHITGIYGDAIRLVYTYSLSAPPVVNVTINGNIPGWSCLTLWDWNGFDNPMTLNVLRWGNIGATQLDLGPEEHMVGLTAGPPPLSITQMNFFFPFITYDPPGSFPAYFKVIPNVIIDAKLELWDTSRIDLMVGMFHGAETITLNTGNWNVSSLQNAQYMFKFVSSPINVTYWDTRSLQNTGSMFYYLGYPIDVSRWNVQNLRDMYGMFLYSFDQISLDVSNWNTFNLKTIDNAFHGIAGTLWNQPETRPMFNNWYLRNVTTCAYFIQSSNYFLVRDTIYSTTQYDLILNSFNYNTTVSLVCNWGTGGGFRFPIMAQYSAAAVTSRAALIIRGWVISDFGLAP